MTPRPPPALITPLWTCDEIHVPCSAGHDSEETKKGTVGEFLAIVLGAEGLLHHAAGVDESEGHRSPGKE